MSTSEKINGVGYRSFLTMRAEGKFPHGTRVVVEGRFEWPYVASDVVGREHLLRVGASDHYYEPQEFIGEKRWHIITPADVAKVPYVTTEFLVGGFFEAFRCAHSVGGHTTRS